MTRKTYGAITGVVEGAFVTWFWVHFGILAGGLLLIFALGLVLDYSYWMDHYHKMSSASQSDEQSTQHDPT